MRNTMKKRFGLMLFLLCCFAVASLSASEPALSVSFDKKVTPETQMLKYDQWRAFKGGSRIKRSEFFSLTGETEKAVAFKDTEKRLTTDRVLMWTSFTVAAAGYGFSAWFGIAAFQLLNGNDSSAAEGLGMALGGTYMLVLSAICGAVGIGGTLLGIPFVARIADLKKKQTVSVDFVVKLRDDYNAKL